MIKSGLVALYIDSKIAVHELHMIFLSLKIIQKIFLLTNFFGSLRRLFYLRIKNFCCLMKTQDERFRKFFHFFVIQSDLEVQFFFIICDLVRKGKLYFHTTKGRITTIKLSTLCYFQHFLIFFGLRDDQKLNLFENMMISIQNTSTTCE